MPDPDAQPPPATPDDGSSGSESEGEPSASEAGTSGSGGSSSAAGSDEPSPAHAQRSRPEDALVGRALALVRFLRSGCSWDAAQTPETLRPYLLEEAHEVSEAILAGDREGLVDELGDLLLNLAFQIVVAEEEGEFDAADVVRGLEEKMEARHPHVYGDAEPPDWEEMKVRHAREGGEGAGRPRADGVAEDRERADPEGERDPDEEGVGTRGDPFAGIPRSLTPLLRALRVQDRAAGHGFDWPDAGGAADKLREELGEVERTLEAGGSEEAEAGTSGSDGGTRSRETRPRAGRGHLEEEIGDLLFAAVNVARLAGVHPSVALAAATRKFERRFSRLVRLARTRDVELEGAPLAELDGLWEEVKEGEEGEEKEGP